MYVIFLAGGIASGKSTVARIMESLGARRLDLDSLSRIVLEPGSPCLAQVVDVFGEDLVDARTGALDRSLLASRAFSTPQGAARLEDIELPFVRDALLARLREMEQSAADGACVVEVPLLDRMGPLIDIADEIVCVTCPLEVRRARAVGRGMDAADFDRRAANQPSDEYLRAHADTVLDTACERGALVSAIRSWWDARAASGWAAKGRAGR